MSGNKTDLLAACDYVSYNTITDWGHLNSIPSSSGLTSDKTVTLHCIKCLQSVSFSGPYQTSGHHMVANTVPKLQVLLMPLTWKMRNHNLYFSSKVIKIRKKIGWVLHVACRHKICRKSSANQTTFHFDWQKGFTKLRNNTILPFQVCPRC
jgi:hypothetical protein